jgi:SAM-dependent methyltransferase
VGGELELFAHAINWKRYFGSRIAEFIRGDVLEVGAGIGETTRRLADGRQRSWTCLEPDPALAGDLRRRLASEPVKPEPVVQVGTTADLAAAGQFDALLYIDVLEHIEDDADELRRAAGLLRRGGVVLILSPAFEILFSPFDRSVGHYRRYTKRSLAALASERLRVRRMFYLDSAGLLLSLANRVLLRQSLPTAGQIATWDRFVVPFSRLVDPLVGHRFGRSVVGVFERV